MNVGVDVQASDHDAGHDECAILGMANAIHAKLAFFACCFHVHAKETLRCGREVEKRIEETQVEITLDLGAPARIGEVLELAGDIESAIGEAAFAGCDANRAQIERGAGEIQSGLKEAVVGGRRAVRKTEIGCADFNAVGFGRRWGGRHPGHAQ